MVIGQKFNGSAETGTYLSWSDNPASTQTLQKFSKEIENL